MSVKFELEGFDEFEKTLANMIEVKYPEEVKKILYEIADELKEDAKRRTPVGTEKKSKSKRLANKWKVGKVKKYRGEFYIEVKNTAPHAHLIEDGHRIVSKDGATHGWWEGKHMLLISVKKLEQKIEPRLQAWLNEMLEELSL